MLLLCLYSILSKDSIFIYFNLCISFFKDILFIYAFLFLCISCYFSHPCFWHNFLYLKLICISLILHCSLTVENYNLHVVDNLMFKPQSPPFAACYCCASTVVFLKTLFLSSAEWGKEERVDFWALGKATSIVTPGRPGLPAIGCKFVNTLLLRGPITFISCCYLNVTDTMTSITDIVSVINNTCKSLIRCTNPVSLRIRFWWMGMATSSLINYWGLFE